MAGCSNICNVMNRRKTLRADMMETPLSRCLSTLDLTFLGVSYMIGPGIFVVTGTIVRFTAGPATLLSYLFAGLAATLSALCYAEFGARVPLAGSAYTYTYVTMGEFWAFAVGWNMLLEYLIAVASSAKAWSGTLDALCNGAISRGIISVFGSINVTGLTPYLDFVAIGIIVLAVIFVASGAKSSANVNNVLTVLIIINIIIIIVTGLTVAHLSNWTTEVPPGKTEPGGFLPYGWSGVFAGAATCFYSYLGFDGIAVAGEEATNPRRAIPIATGVSMFVVTTMYVVCTAVLTLMMPYYDVNTLAPFPVAFAAANMAWAKYVVSIGALLAITTTITGGMFFLPRIAYAMASDGVMFRWIGKIHPKTQTPIVAIILSGVLAAILAFILALDVLVRLMSIGTLVSFTFVAACVIILRYRPPKQEEGVLESIRAEYLKLADVPNKPDYASTQTGEKGETGNSNQVTRRGSSRPKAEEQLLGREHGPVDSEKGMSRWGAGMARARRVVTKTGPLAKYDQGDAVTALVVIMSICILLGVIMVLYGGYLIPAGWWGYAIACLIPWLGAFGCMGMISCFPQLGKVDSFQVPLVPLIPFLSITFNLAMLVKLDYFTWIRLVVWMGLGLLVYFCYGTSHSDENKNQEILETLPSYEEVMGSNDVSNGDDDFIRKMNSAVPQTTPMAIQPAQR